MSTKGIVSNFEDVDLVPPNVKNTVDIFGVVGTFAGGGTPTGISNRTYLGMVNHSKSNTAYIRGITGRVHLYNGKIYFCFLNGISNNNSGPTKMTIYKYNGTTISLIYVSGQGNNSTLPGGSELISANAGGNIISWGYSTAAEYFGFDLDTEAGVAYAGGADLNSSEVYGGKTYTCGGETLEAPSNYSYCQAAYLTII